MLFYGIDSFLFPETNHMKSEQVFFSYKIFIKYVSYCIMIYHKYKEFHAFLGTVRALPEPFGETFNSIILLGVNNVTDNTHQLQSKPNHSHSWGLKHST